MSPPNGKRRPGGTDGGSGTSDDLAGQSQDYSAHAGALRLAKIADRLEHRNMVRPARAIRLIGGILIDEHLSWYAEAHTVWTGFRAVDGALLLHAFDEAGDLTTETSMEYERWSTLGDAA